MAEATVRGDRTGLGRVLLAWIAVGLGVVLLVRLAVQGVRAAGYAAAWLDDLVLSELMAGLGFSLFDLAILLVAAVVGVWSGLASDGDSTPGDGR